MPSKRKSSISSNGSGGSSSSVKYRVVDPYGQYKAIRKVISNDCIRQKCIISFTCRDVEGEGEAECSNYFGSRVTLKLLNHSFTENCIPENIEELYPGISEIALHVSDVPTMSVLLIKTETSSSKLGSVDLRYYSSAVDLNGLDTSIFQGLSTRNTFKLCFREFVYETSEFSFDIELLESAVLKTHTIAEIPKKSKFVVQVFEFLFKLNSSAKDDTTSRDKKKKEDIDWFYYQLNKYHASEELPRNSVLQHPHIIPTLREYQKDAVNWMLNREGVMPNYDPGAPSLIDTILDKMYISVTLKRSYEDQTEVPAFFNQYAGYICRVRPTLPPLPTGGILADEMGLGKTVEVLSLIMLNPKPSIEGTSETTHNPIKIKRQRVSSPCEFRTKEYNPQSPAIVPLQKKRKLDDNLHSLAWKVIKGTKNEEAMEVTREMEDAKPLLQHGGTGIKKMKKKRRIGMKLSAAKKRKETKRRNSKSQVKQVEAMDEEDEHIKAKTNNSSLKGKLYDKIRPLYDAALGEYSSSKHAVVTHKFHGEFFNPHVGRKAFFECICGEGLEDDSDNVITCISCSSSQHKTCVSYNVNLPSPGDVSSDGYVCPHCTVLLVMKKRDSLLSEAIALPPIETKTTLIVTPNTIAHQWINEIRRHVGKEHMKILFYKGASVHGYVPPQQLAQYDLIITTYGILSSDLNYVDLPHSNSAEGRRFRNPKRFLPIPSPLPSILFWRICLDEAQMVEGIATRMSNMALKLNSVHSWCITGTPLNKSLEDLYGLFLFLGISPVNDPFWWNSLVTNSFYQKEASLLYDLFGTLIWRNGKRDVLDQLGIPPQSQIVHWLNFSPVEAHFYKRLYDACGTKVVEKVEKICQNSQEGLTMRLSNLDRKALHELLTPFLELRQACCHPQLVGNSLSLKNVNETITMEELLTQLIQKTKIKCAEAHRIVISALNGAAGIHWILEEHIQASDKYREILQLATKHEKLFKTDTLQMLHTLENLADLLDMNCQGVPYTLRDDTLRVEAEALRVKYLENHAIGVNTAHSAAQKASTAVEELRTQFRWKNTSWWMEIVHDAIKREKAEDLIVRIKDVLSVYASKKDNKDSTSMAKRFIGPASFQKIMIERITELEKLRFDVLQTLDELLSENPASFVDSCVACHLRKYSGATVSHDFRCRLCVNLDKFSEYQHSLFSEDMGNIKKKISRTGRNRQKLKITGNLEDLSAEEERLAILREEEELIETTGHVEFHNIEHDRKMLGDSDPEKALRQLITYGRVNKLNDSLLEDGATHMKLYDSMKKEFKLLRVLWTRMFDQVSAIDELSQATTRISLRVDGSSTAGPSTPKQPKTLKNLELERAKKIQELNLVSAIELHPKLDDLKLEYGSAQADFNIHHGQLVYLERMEKNNRGKTQVFNEEECPVCHSALGKAWSVLVCGHSYCSDCIKKICHHPTQSFSCPLCRHCMKMSDVSFVDISVNTKEQDEAQPSLDNVSIQPHQVVPDTRTVRGSHSTKVQAVVEQLLQLQYSHPGEKVIIFSTWSVVLDIIGRALEQNDILFASLKTGESKGNFQKTLARFQERADIQVLLLPLSSGGKGLNIIEATHVFLVEPILNMASEQQAIGRVHRIGQTKPTFIHRFYVRNTIEEHLFEVLKNHDVSGDEEGLLSLGDLKNLVTR